MLAVTVINMASSLCTHQEDDMDTAVMWIMFILILVFDPLAVIMVIGFNIALLNGKKRPDENDDSEKTYKVYNQPPPTPKVYTSLDKPSWQSEDKPEEDAGSPLEAWAKETEKKIEDEGIDMGQEAPQPKHRNPSKDGGPDSAEPEWDAGRK